MGVKVILEEHIKDANATSQSMKGRKILTQTNGLAMRMSIVGQSARDGLAQQPWRAIDVIR